jgi:hypothetical protein
LSGSENSLGLTAREVSGKALYYLVVAVALLALGSTVAVLTDYQRAGLIQPDRVFYLGTRNGVSTWFLSLLLASCAAILHRIACDLRSAGEGRYVPHWRVLAWLFLLLSFDEAVGAHGKLGAMLVSPSLMKGWLFYGWVILYAPLIAIFSLSYLGFLAHLHRRTRLLFIISGGLCLAGGFLLEIPLGKVHQLYGPRTLFFGLFVTFKKTVEMAGVVTFLYALLSHPRPNIGGPLPNPSAAREEQSRPVWPVFHSDVPNDSRDKQKRVEENGLQ